MGGYHLCKQALPEVPAFYNGDIKYFPVTPFCKCAKAVYEDDKNHRIAMSEEKRATHCGITCPMFTDKTRMIRVSNRDFRAEIYLDRLADLSMENTRKLFKLIFTAEQENQEAIALLGEYIEQKIEESKKIWRQFSINFTDGWRDTKSPWTSYLSPQARKKAEAQNRKLTAAVKSAKAKHDRWEKVSAEWSKAKTKYAY